MLEAGLLLIVGFLMTKFGSYFLGEYRKAFEGERKLTITWDIVVHILDSGASDGRLGVMLLILGGFLMLIAAILFFASLF